MPDQVVPIGSAQQLQVEQFTLECIARAQTLLALRLPPIPVVFDLKGSAAGMFRAQGRDCRIRYNPWIFAKYFEQNLAHTVPHEVAHYAVYRQWGRGKVRPHGAEWRWLMGQFGVPAEVTFNLDLTGVPRRQQQRHAYRCACREHAVSSVRHNRMQRGQASYRCRYCDSPLLALAPISGINC